MKPSPKQLKQRRIMAAQYYTNDTAKRERQALGPKAPRSTGGHANIGTDEDIRKYCERMGYAYLRTTVKP